MRPINFNPFCKKSFRLFLFLIVLTPPTLFASEDGETEDSSEAQTVQTKTSTSPRRESWFFKTSITAGGALFRKGLDKKIGANAANAAKPETKAQAGLDFSFLFSTGQSTALGPAFRFTSESWKNPAREEVKHNEYFLGIDWIHSFSDTVGDGFYLDGNIGLTHSMIWKEKNTYVSVPLGKIPVPIKVKTDIINISSSNGLGFSLGTGYAFGLWKRNPDTRFWMRMMLGISYSQFYASDLTMGYLAGKIGILF